MVLVLYLQQSPALVVVVVAMAVAAVANPRFKARLEALVAAP
jgi:hypothetical protein